MFDIKLYLIIILILDRSDWSRVSLGEDSIKLYNIKIESNFYNLFSKLLNFLIKFTKILLLSEIYRRPIGDQWLNYVNHI